MKILHVLSGSHFGGASVMAAELATAQRDLGVDAQICLLEGGQTAEQFRKFRSPVLAYNLGERRNTKYSRWAALYHCFQEIVQKFSPDILHSHLPLPNLMCGRWKRDNPTKWLATLHGSWRQYMYSPETSGAVWKRPYLMLRYSLGVAWTTRRADMIATMTHDAANDWQRVGIARPRIRIIPNGIVSPQSKDGNIRAKLSLPDNCVLIGTLGYFAPVKGFDLLITAFSRIADNYPKSHLLVAGGDVHGNTSVRNELRRLIRESPARERITLLGEQTDSAQYLASLDGFVLASRSEGMSLALMEAMHIGLPCIVSSAGGNPETVRDLMDGYVFRNGNVSDLSRKLSQFLADPNGARAMGASGRERARSLLSMERCAQDYLALYNEILRN